MSIALRLFAAFAVAVFAVACTSKTDGVRPVDDFDLDLDLRDPDEGPADTDAELDAVDDAPDLDDGGDAGDDAPDVADTDDAADPDDGRDGDDRPEVADTDDSADPDVPTGPRVVITEIMYDPKGVPAGGPGDTLGEWFELYNPGAAPVNLRGWGVADQGLFDANDRRVITADLILPPGGYVVLGRSADRATNGGVDVAFVYAEGGAMSLANTGDAVIVTSPTGQIVDRAAYGADAAPEGSSLQLDPSALTPEANDAAADWCPSTASFGTQGAKGTPGAANTPCGGSPVDEDEADREPEREPEPDPEPVELELEVVADADEKVDTDTRDPDEQDAEAEPEPEADVGPGAPLVITEIMADPSVGSVGEWIEIYNPGTAAVDLTGYGFSDDAARASPYIVTVPIVVPPGGYAVVARSDDAIANGGVPAVVAVGSKFQLSNSGDTVYVFGPDRAVIDRAAYPGRLVRTGISVQLDPGALDATANDDAANWCLSTAAFGTQKGTPGTPNTPCNAAGGDEDDAVDAIDADNADADDADAGDTIDGDTGGFDIACTGTTKVCLDGDVYTCTGGKLLVTDVCSIRNLVCDRATTRCVAPAAAGRLLGVVSSNYQRSSISLVAADGASVDADVLFSAGGTDGNRLSGDVVALDTDAPPGTAVFLDRTRGLVLWVDGTGEQQRIDVTCGGRLAANPHDAAWVSGEKLYVTRFGKSTTESGPCGGDDVAVYEPRNGDFVGRIDLSAEVTAGFTAQPDRLLYVPARNLLVVTANHANAAFAQSNGLVYFIDTRTDEVLDAWRDPTFKGCSGVTYDAVNDQIVVACSGSFGGPAEESGLLVFSAATRALARRIEAGLRIDGQIGGGSVAGDGNVYYAIRPGDFGSRGDELIELGPTAGARVLDRVAGSYALADVKLDAQTGIITLADATAREFAIGGLRRLQLVPTTVGDGSGVVPLTGVMVSGLADPPRSVGAPAPSVTTVPVAACAPADVSGGNLAVPDNTAAGATVRLDLPTDSVQGALLLDLTVRHAVVSQLVVTLTSPRGTVLTVWNRFDSSTPDIAFVGSDVSPYFLNESWRGTWQLKVRDAAAGTSGRIESVRLRRACRPACAAAALAAGGVPANIPDGTASNVGTVQLSVFNDRPSDGAAVLLDLAIDHAYPDDVGAFLVAPSGRDYFIDTGAFVGTKLRLYGVDITADLAGENVLGTWTLVVGDFAAQDTGRVLGFGLRFACAGAPVEVEVETEGDADVVDIDDTADTAADTDPNDTAGDDITSADGDDATTDAADDAAGDPVTDGTDTDVPAGTPVLLVTEILINPGAVSGDTPGSTVDDNPGEWVEIANLGTGAVDLQGYTIGTQSEYQSASARVTINRSVPVPAGGHVVLGRSADTGLNGNVQVDFVYVSSPTAQPMTFSNSSADGFWLMTADGTVLDVVTWTGSGQPVASGIAWQRRPSVTQPSTSYNGTQWCQAPDTARFGPSAGPTQRGSPRQPNPACP